MIAKCNSLNYSFFINFYRKMDINIPYYEDNSRISNSAIGWFLISPRYYRDMMDGNIKNKPTQSMEDGSMIHMYLLQPEEFKKNYIILDFQTPSSQQQKQFCNDYINSKANKPIYKAIEAFKANYNTSGKSDDKIAKESLEMALKLKSYIKFLRSSDSGKKVISWADMGMLMNIKKNVQSHKKANELLFNRVDSPNIIAINEFHINWTWRLRPKDMLEVERTSMECKSLIDRLIIDHDNKSITLVDIKTTVSVAGFKESFTKFDYARQMAYYWFAITWYFDNELNIDISEYSHNTYIVAIQNNGSNECRVFEVPENAIIEKSEKIKEILSEIDWHMSNDLWEYRKEYYEGDGTESLLYD